MSMSQVLCHSFSWERRDPARLQKPRWSVALPGTALENWQWMYATDISHTGIGVKAAIMADCKAALIPIHIELFGLAQLVCNRRQVSLEVPSEAAIADITAALADACPALVGPVIRDDLSGLYESYVLNLNGLAFVARKRLQLQPGDTLLLFSSQAGG